MATVDKPRYGVEVTYVNSTRPITIWYATEKARDKRHTQLQRDKNVRTAKRVKR